MPGGSWLFRGQDFADERGSSHEIFDAASWPGNDGAFVAAQENLISTGSAGCARGLHYQVGPLAQAKLVTVLRGSAQFFWIPLADDSGAARAHSVVLAAGAVSLFTPGDCAHGFLALKDDTQFLLKMSAPTSPPHRGEVSFLSKDLAIDFEVELRRDLLSGRDSSAPNWTMRRRA